MNFGNANLEICELVEVMSLKLISYNYYIPSVKPGTSLQTISCKTESVLK